ncbi:MAG: hypothetical protein H6799_03665 [Candidatus Nomurabacteria bacterium]|nr:MAG: hypothetical protein H6799_03665 [Candidatus Nomurabacteria bacterium]
MKIKLQKPKNLAQNFDFKKSVDKAHKNIHRRSLTSTRRHIVGKADSIKNLRARKLVFSWSAKFLIVLVLGLLSYSKLNSAGRFTGFVGGGEVIAGIEDPNEQINLNPLTLSTPAESAVGRLIYSSILKYDQEGKLKGDLAKSYSIEDSGKKIRVRLKDNIKWHDKKSIVADDIVFTFTKLKDIRVNSSLRDSLNGVDVVALDNKNFEITSPRVVSGLDDLLTKIRIAPKHIFE